MCDRRLLTQKAQNKNGCGEGASGYNECDKCIHLQLIDGGPLLLLCGGEVWRCPIMRQTYSKHSRQNFNRQPENDSFQKGCHVHVPSQTLGRYVPSGNAFSTRGLDGAG